MGVRFMTNEEIVFPLAGGIEGSELRPVGARLLAHEDPAPRTSLESERLGLLAGPAAAPDPDRRIEEWIASNLDLGDQADQTPRSAWVRIIDGLSGMKRPVKEKQQREKGRESRQDGWARFQVAYKRGITVVRVLDKTLVRENQIHELACDLLDLIAAGNHRVVLNFQVVERLASWVVVAVEEARRRCEAADGGALKICGLPQQLAAIFPIAGVPLRLSVHADEASAIDSPWPEPSGPRPLPIEILTALTRAADLPPLRGGAPFLVGRIDNPSYIPPVSGGAPSLVGRIDNPSYIPPLRGGAPSDAAEVSKPVAPSPTASFSTRVAGGVSRAETGVWLKIQVGSAQGRLVEVSGRKLVIGRDQACHLRLGSATVSKLHAAIERRDGRVFVSDLGSTNGTITNGRLVRNSELEVKDGDRIQIGPIVITVVIARERPHTGKVEDLVAGWLQGEGPARSYQDDAQATELIPTTAQTEPEQRIKFEVIQEVLVVTPQVSELDDAETIELLRSHLHALFDPPMPRQVVVNLEYIRHLSAAAIGVLLAHHLRLDRAGGALRICQAHARVMAVLHNVRLTMLVECHPTLDEAVLGAWPGMPKTQAAGE
jgi:anti-anti-sigma factor